MEALGKVAGYIRRIASRPLAGEDRESPKFFFLKPVLSQRSTSSTSSVFGSNSGAVAEGEQQSSGNCRGRAENPSPFQSPSIAFRDEGF